MEKGNYGYIGAFLCYLTTLTINDWTIINMFLGYIEVWYGSESMLFPFDHGITRTDLSI